MGSRNPVKCSIILFGNLPRCLCYISPVENPCILYVSLIIVIVYQSGLQSTWNENIDPSSTVLCTSKKFLVFGGLNSIEIYPTTVCLLELWSDIEVDQDKDTWRVFALQQEFEGDRSS